MSATPAPQPPSAASGPAAAARLVGAVLGLAALVVLMLGAFALPGVHGGPHEVPIGLTGPRAATEPLQERLDGDEWDVTLYEDAGALADAVEDREITGGLALAADGIDVYTATAGTPLAAGALTAMADSAAARQQAAATVHDLAPFPEDDPRGSGFAAAGLPLIFGGILPAAVLSRVFPGRANVRLRLAGAVLFSLVAGAAATAVLQYATGSLAGDYWVSALGLGLGVAALSVAFVGLEALLGLGGPATGAAVMMLLGNPLSGLATGPHWLPPGWAALGQLLPPGAAGSLLRANAFFDGTGAAEPSLVLAAWVVFGLVLGFAAHLRRPAAARPPARR
ncbi:hypothetical protein ACFPZ0_20835 [Streptomonospora nanhaiensis]|uniref:hypothetical protein n=1 Tax=Streptomonospora nanhaiensis TaxID=1323731 RepID=UPI001C992F29|nr:hypothetical protein [Streptomonospora nanhaiensis]MBX9391225.1 hypothetical protein [Streptomonospora nanhaiensis]